LENQFYQNIQQAYQTNATLDELKDLLGKGKARKGIFEGDVLNGELEIGQVSALINNIETAKEVIDDIVLEFNNEMKKISKVSL